MRYTAEMSDWMLMSFSDSCSDGKRHLAGLTANERQRWELHVEKWFIFINSSLTAEFAGVNFHSWFSDIFSYFGLTVACRSEESRCRYEQGLFATAWSSGTIAVCASRGCYPLSVLTWESEAAMSADRGSGAWGGTNRSRVALLARSRAFQTTLEWIVALEHCSFSKAVRLGTCVGNLPSWVRSETGAVSLFSSFYVSPVVEARDICGPMLAGTTSLKRCPYFLRVRTEKTRRRAVDFASTRSSVFSYSDISS